MSARQSEALAAGTPRVAKPFGDRDEFLEAVEPDRLEHPGLFEMELLRRDRRGLRHEERRSLPVLPPNRLDHVLRDLHLAGAVPSVDVVRPATDELAVAQGDLPV